MPVNHAGTGNTLALDRPAVVALVVDALRHWAGATGIDGFRHDLATVMGRTERGFDPEAPLIAAIERDPVLGALVHIAEPWDVGTGRLPARSVPASAGMNGTTATATTCAASGGAMAGQARWRPGSPAPPTSSSPPARRRRAASTIVACHDGFTLATR